MRSIKPSIVLESLDLFNGLEKYLCAPAFAAAKRALISLRTEMKMIGGQSVNSLFSFSIVSAPAISPSLKTISMIIAEGISCRTAATKLSKFEKCLTTKLSR